ncbi:BON domain-containing protein [Cupriavidus agavae]|uniref:BON domain-containing protein n=1 Tax=Cupriavidus agavae TaxID=1001822 RepID=A0A4Q7RG14_9BURK|nr:BON domain-containing protein [Cupriavidus agavae]RZT31358.1 BON domain-containing protein [Cupriavidus agavae]
MTEQNRWFKAGVPNEGSDWAVHDQTEDIGNKPDSYPRPWARQARDGRGIGADARVDPAAYGIDENDGLRAGPGRGTWNRAADVNWQDRHTDDALRHRPGAGGRAAGMPREREGADFNPLQRGEPRWPKGYQRADERVRDDVCERLADDAHLDLSEVEVDVAAGVVSLRGTVRDRGQKHRIEDIADHVIGVKDVQNHLRVQT